jgi:hypothetical protein
VRDATGEQLMASLRSPLTGAGLVLSVTLVAIQPPPRRHRVRAPAPDLAPQSFGRYVNANFHVSVLLGGLSLLLCLIVILITGKYHPLPYLAVFYTLLALSGLLFRDTWVAGGDGWLMLLRGREPRAWVRTSQLAYVGLESKYQGEGDYRPHLTLRDDAGRELKTWLSKLPAGAAESVLAGIDQAAQAGLVDPDSPQVSAAVAALHERAGISRAGRGL